MTKKYKLHCFKCRRLFLNKKEVGRIGKYPFCKDCIPEILTSNQSFYKENDEDYILEEAEEDE